MHLVLDGCLEMVSVSIVFVSGLVIKVPESSEFLLHGKELEVEIVVSLMNHILVNFVLVSNDLPHFSDVSIQSFKIFPNVIFVILVSINILGELGLVLLNVLESLHIHFVELVKVNLKKHVVREDESSSLEIKLIKLLAITLGATNFAFDVARLATS
jgi:ethanolamine transporter EutH